MHRATKLSELPALTRDFLQQSGLLMDNVLASLWQQVGMKTLFLCTDTALTAAQILELYAMR